MRGSTVRIHPANDMFMRGEIHATILGEGKDQCLKVEGFRSGKIFYLPIHDALTMEGEPWTKQPLPHKR